MSKVCVVKSYVSRCSLALVTHVAIALAMPAMSEAQQQTSNTPATTSGVTPTTTATAGSTTTGTTSSTASSQGGNLTGQGVGQPQFRAFGEAVNQNPTGFVGRGANEGFIGQQLAGQADVGAGVGPQFGGLGANRDNTSTGQGQTTGPSRAARLRPRHRVAFSYSPHRSDVVRSSLQTHFGSLRDRVSGVETSLTPDGTLILQGSAVSPEAKKLAEALARLEPGVRRIDNQITVSPAPPRLEPPTEVPH